MKLKKLMGQLDYVGDAAGKRQSYHVFRGGDSFLVLSFSKTKAQAGNFNLVEQDAVEYVQSRFRGQKAVTSNDIVAKASRTRHVPTRLAALNILYVLVALGMAKVDSRRGGQKLYFNFSRERA